MALPEEYRGIVVEREASEAKQANGDSAHEDIDMADENAEKPVETGSLRATAEFDKVVIWGHEAVASAEEDPYIRSIEEWLQVSEKVGLPTCECRRLGC